MSRLSAAAGSLLGAVGGATVGSSIAIGRLGLPKNQEFKRSVIGATIGSWIGSMLGVAAFAGCPKPQLAQSAGFP